MGSPQTYNERILEADQGTLPDPGTSGLINCGQRMVTHISFATAATGNRDVIDPVIPGQILTICTNGAPTTSVVARFGSVSGSSAGRYGANYNNVASGSAMASVTLNADSEMAKFEAMRIGGALRWVLILTIGGAIA